MATRTGVNATSPGVAAFGIIGGDGLPVDPEGRSKSSPWDPAHRVNPSSGSNSVLVTFPQPMPMRGWFLITDTKQGSIDKDPSYFEVHGKNNQEADWTLVGVPVWLIGTNSGLSR